MPIANDVSQAFSLRGETAMITGGGTGLGFGIAHCFVAAGARVLLVGRREDKLREAVDILGKQATAMPLDITDRAASASKVAAAQRDHGPITVLVNNAGIHLKKPAVNTTPDEFSSVLDSHVLSAH